MLSLNRALAALDLALLTPEAQDTVDVSGRLLHIQTMALSTVQRM